MKQATDNSSKRAQNTTPGKQTANAAARLTVFQRRVYDALREVPAGRVTTYRLLARRIGCGSARAVGGALRRNPFAPEVPCHRVIASDGTVGGFQGRREGPAIRRKLELLRGEGVRFDKAGQLADFARLYSFGLRPAASAFPDHTATGIILSERRAGRSGATAAPSRKDP